MNVRETGTRTARQISTMLGFGGAALASLIGISVWAGASSHSSTSSTVSGTSQGDDGNQLNQQQNGFNSQSGIGFGNGGGSHVKSNGS